MTLAVSPEVAASMVLAAHDGLTLHSRLGRPSDEAMRPERVLSALVSILTSPPENAPVVPPARKRTASRKK
jgi:hypothetical protein